MGEGGCGKMSHVDERGVARMVDVGEKAISERSARGEAIVTISGELEHAIRENTLKKGDALGVARLAGIMAAKRTSDLIPLCHPLALDHVDVDCSVEAGCVRITTRVRTSGRTGVEMEALTAASVAALAIYDMGKSIDKSMTIASIRLLEKTGGRSGTYRVTGEGGA